MFPGFVRDSVGPTRWTEHYLFARDASLLLVLIRSLAQFLTVVAKIGARSVLSRSMEFIGIPQGNAICRPLRRGRHGRRLGSRKGTAIQAVALGLGLTLDVFPNVWAERRPIWLNA